MSPIADAACAAQRRPAAAAAAAAAAASAAACFGHHHPRLFLQQQQQHHQQPQQRFLPRPRGVLMAAAGSSSGRAGPAALGAAASAAARRRAPLAAPPLPLGRRRTQPAALPREGGAWTPGAAAPSSSGGAPAASATTAAAAASSSSSGSSSGSSTAAAAAGAGGPFSSVDVDAALEAAAVGLPPPPLQPEGRIAQVVAAAAAAAAADREAAEGGRGGASPLAAAARARAGAAEGGSGHASAHADGGDLGPLRLERPEGPAAAFQDGSEGPLLRSFAEEDDRGSSGGNGKGGKSKGVGGLRAPSLLRRAAPSNNAAASASGAASPPSPDAGGNNNNSSSNQNSSSSNNAAAAPAPAAAAPSPQPAAGLVAGVPPPVVVLSLVSMALTSASCVFNTLLPIYMVAELKMPMASMGAFEGLLEAFSYAVRMASGVLSDRLGSRKAAIAAGFAMGAAAKLGLSFASALPQLFAGKALDRLANGVQAAPRDALIGDLSPAASRSACFGFAQSMRKWGSFVGAGLAFALMKGTDGNYRAIFLAATGVTVMATVAFVILVPGGGQQQQQQQGQQQQQAPLLRAAAGAAGKTAAAAAPSASSSFARSASRLLADVSQMSVDFWRTLAVICMYGAGHVNESLLEARAMEVGFGKAESALVVAALCFAVFLCAYPLGRLDDAWGHRTTFSVGMAALIAGDLCLVCSSASAPWAVFVATAFWGAHVAVLQGPMLSVVVGLAPSHLKGTAFGIFYSAMAAVAVVANTAYGLVWQNFGAPCAYGLSAALVSVALLVGAPLLLPRSRAMDGPGWREKWGKKEGGEGSGGEGRPAAA